MPVLNLSAFFDRVISRLGMAALVGDSTATRGKSLASPNQVTNSSRPEENTGRIKKLGSPRASTVRGDHNGPDKRHRQKRAFLQGLDGIRELALVIVLVGAGVILVVFLLLRSRKRSFA